MRDLKAAVGLLSTWTVLICSYIKAAPGSLKSCPSYKFNSLNFDSEKISVITPWDHLKIKCCSTQGGLFFCFMNRIEIWLIVLCEIPVHVRSHTSRISVVNFHGNLSKSILVIYSPINIIFGHKVTEINIANTSMLLHMYMTLLLAV